MKRVWILLLSWVFLLAWLLPALAAEPLKIAYVDIQKALNFCEAGKEAKKLITAEVEKMQKNFAGRQKELEKIKEDLEKRGAVLSESVRKDRERDYQAKLVALQRLQRDYEEDLRRKDRELTDRILKTMEEIVKKMGEEGKYTVILEKNQPTILYISPVLDLTEEVIKRIDQKPRVSN